MSDLFINFLSLFLNTKVFIIILFIIILIIIVNKLYNKNNTHIETFSVLKNLKNKSNNKINKKLNSKSKQKKSNFKNISNNEITFDVLMKKTENFTKEKDKLLSFTDSIDKYKKSFNNKKFKNNSTNTAESFEKFALYKDKFLDLFKFK